jgi:hypothetical protein
LLDLRVYRTAFLPALIAVFVVAFSLQSRPSPVRTRAVADAFDPARAYGSERARDSLLELGAAFPDRRPGSEGDRALADRVAGVMEASGMEVSRSTSTGRTIDGEADIETVEGVRPGLSPRQIVVLAHRDAASSPGLAELSGTAALIELARVFRTKVSRAEGTDDPGRPQLIGRDLRRTLVLVSTSGGSGGAAGAREWARNADPSLIDGVLVLGDIASAKSRKPWVVPWSDGRDQPPIGFVRTVELAARAESAEDPGRQRATAQWARRALPFTVSEQGEIDRAGLPGALLQASGELGPAPGAELSRARFTALGRAALRTVTVIDEAGRGRGDAEVRALWQGEPAGVVTLRNVAPDWSIRLLVLCLLAPALLAALDAFFRVRRRHVATGAWLGWALAAGAIVPLAWAWLRVLGITGALPAPRAPVAPGVLELTGGQIAALASVALAVVAGVVIARALTRGDARESAAAGGAGAAAGAIVCTTTLAVWVANPYAAALLLPAAHLWLFLGMPQTRMRGAVGWAALLAGLVAPALVVVYGMLALDTGPLQLARMWLVATAGGHVSAWAALALGALTGAFALLVRVLRDRRHLARETPAAKPRTRGPRTYAGPGSLGGTESALRR